jgi:hypothetical protein
MKASNFALTLALALSVSTSMLGGLARAQDQGGLRPADQAQPQDPVAPPATTQPPMNTPQAPSTADTPTVEGPNAKDPGGWKGQTPPPTQAGVPQASEPLAQNPAPQVDPAQAEEQKRKDDRIIDRNYEEAIKTYEKSFSEGESVGDLDHRIQTNEKMIATYKKRLAEANEVKRRQQVELFNRTFYLKQQRDKGAIPEDTFDKLMKQEEKKYNEKTAQARSDIEFFEKEIGDAEKRLNDLKAERRISVVNQKTTTMANGKPKKPPMKQSARVVSSLTERLKRLSEFDPKHTMDTATLEVGPAAPPAPAAPNPDQAAPAPPN